jgi:hypothetical protein
MPNQGVCGCNPFPKEKRRFASQGPSPPLGLSFNQAGRLSFLAHAPLHQVLYWYTLLFSGPSPYFEGDDGGSFNYVKVMNILGQAGWGWLRQDSQPKVGVHIYTCFIEE